MSYADQPRERAKRFALAVSALALWTSSATAQQDAGPFTAGQAAQGHTDYSTACAACHQENLAGGGEAPSWPGAIL